MATILVATPLGFGFPVKVSDEGFGPIIETHTQIYD